ncbi:MAG TPA: GNAT family protein [Parafilimonas sp.]|nr:GNAT family protein [Parafilimonas sp.]
MLQLNLYPFPQLETERLLLREITRADAADFFTLRSNKDLMQYIDRPLAQTMQDALNLIGIIITALKNNDGITWGISLKNDAQLIGTIGLWRIIKEHYRAEIGYLLSDAFQRQGIMQEAITAVINYGFNMMGLHSIEANVNPANAASILLLEKNKFIREAHFKENYYYNGKFMDSLVYSLITPNK